MSEPQPATLQGYVAELTDPRRDRGKLHLLLDILGIALWAVLCGADTRVEMEAYGRAKAEWLKQFLPLPNGIPSHDTFARVLARLKPEELQRGFLNWLHAVRELTHGEVVGIEGKTLRRSFARAAGKGAIHLVSAWATANRLGLGQQQVDEKSNEIPAIPALLRRLEVEGCLVTLDALGCQKESARTIVEQGADYVLALKGNQGILHEEGERFFSGARRSKCWDIPSQAPHTVNGAQGRMEERRYWLVSELDWLAETRTGPGVRSFGMVEAQRTVGETITVERRYYLTSLAGDAQLFAQALRSHWGIENGLPWVLDGAFREDESRLRRDPGAQNFAALRHLALSLLQQEKTARGGLKVKRLKAGWDEASLTKGLFPPNYDAFALGAIPPLALCSLSTKFKSNCRLFS